MDSCNPSKNFALKVEKERKWENQKKRYSFQIQKARTHTHTSQALLFHGHVYVETMSRKRGGPTPVNKPRMKAWTSSSIIIISVAGSIAGPLPLGSGPIQTYAPPPVTGHFSTSFFFFPFFFNAKVYRTGGINLNAKLKRE